MLALICILIQSYNDVPKIHETIAEMDQHHQETYFLTKENFLNAARESALGNNENNRKPNELLLTYYTNYLETLNFEYFCWTKPGKVIFPKNLGSLSNDMIKELFEVRAIYQKSDIALLTLHQFMLCAMMTKQAENLKSIREIIRNTEKITRLDQISLFILKENVVSKKTMIKTEILLKNGPGFLKIPDLSIGSLDPIRVSLESSDYTFTIQGISQDSFLSEANNLYFLEYRSIDFSHSREIRVEFRRNSPGTGLLINQIGYSRLKDLENQGFLAENSMNRSYFPYCTYHDLIFRSTNLYIDGADQSILTYFKTHDFNPKSSAITTRIQEDIRNFSSFIFNFFSIWEKTIPHNRGFKLNFGITGYADNTFRNSENWTQSNRRLSNERANIVWRELSGEISRQMPLLNIGKQTVPNLTVCPDEFFNNEGRHVDVVFWITPL